MPSTIEIAVPQLVRIFGSPGAPLLVDVRPRAAFESDPRLLPTARRLDFLTVSDWAHTYRAKRVIVYCQDGGDISRGTAAWLRQAGSDAQTLDGGYGA